MPYRILRRRFLELALLSLNATFFRCTSPARAATPPLTVSVPPVSLAAQKAIVRDANGAPLANARVTLVGADGEFFRETRTNARGEYAFDALPKSNYIIGASAEDFEYREISVTTGAPPLAEFSLAPEANQGRWTTIGNTNPERFGGTNSGVLMPNGKIIYCHDTVRPIVFDPVTGQKEIAPGSPFIQGCHVVTLTTDGRVLYFGGGNVDADGNFDGVSSYDFVKAFAPASKEWQVYAPMLERRWYAGLARLADERMLLYGGGQQPNVVRTATSEIYIPKTQTTMATGSLTEPGGFGNAMLLKNGEVFLSWYPPQIWNPQTGQWRTAANFLQPLRATSGRAIPPIGDHPDHTAIYLSDGRIAAIGIRRTALENPGSMVELYDPATNQWTFGASPRVRRSMCEVVYLPDGTILCAGGKKEDDSATFTNAWGQTRAVDLYNPRQNKWRALNDMANAREYHAITLLLPDGRVVTTAGTAQPGLAPPHSANNDVEAFEPPYLFRGPRPRIKRLATNTFVNGQSFTFNVERTNQISAVILLGMNALTHWMDGGVPRRLKLSFTQKERRVRAKIPSNMLTAPLGYYLLLAMVDGIPSEGKIVCIVAA